MQKLKQKHIWSVQVLDGLLKHNTKYDYEDAGASPFMGNYKLDGSEEISTPYEAIGNSKYINNARHLNCYIHSNPLFTTAMGKCIHSSIS